MYPLWTMLYNSIAFYINSLYVLYEYNFLIISSIRMLSSLYSCYMNTIFFISLLYEYYLLYISFIWMLSSFVSLSISLSDSGVWAWRDDFFNQALTHTNTNKCINTHAHTDVCVYTLTYTYTHTYEQIITLSFTRA